MDGRIDKKRLRSVLIVAATLAAIVAPCLAHASPLRVRRYALVIGNNYSRADGIKPLSFADDDAAKFYELFTAMGAEVRLLAVLDPDAQQHFPEATTASRPPTRGNFDKALSQLFEAMSAATAVADDIETVFYFVYSGHGELGPNREGFLSLLDTRIGRSDLYREVIARSPATWNHVILDACNAFYMVEKRGGANRGDDLNALVRDFLKTEDLRRYPNTGVILAAASESETHEWSRWAAGIFSHELRSAMLGAADVDGDGAVSYGAAAASIEAANADITDPRARLRVYARPPLSRIGLPLVDLKSLQGLPRLAFARAAGHYHVEDSRSVRVADLPGRVTAASSCLAGRRFTCATRPARQ